MDRGLSLLVRLMRESWVFIGNPDGNKKERQGAQESDQEDFFFLSDGTNDS